MDLVGRVTVPPDLDRTIPPPRLAHGSRPKSPSHRAVVVSTMLGPLAPRTRRMHRLTDNLRADHAVTAVGLAALAAVGEHVRRGGAFPAEGWALRVGLVAEFVLAVLLAQ